MNRLRLNISLFALISFLSIQKLVAQTSANPSDSVVQFYGLVMTADSLRGLDGVSVSVQNKGRGTITNPQGVFSIAVLKGDIIEFSYVGYKSTTIRVPSNLRGNEYNLVQLMVSDTLYLPGTVVRPRPTRAQFERDFVNTQVDADEYLIARENTSEQKMAALMYSLPKDGREAVNYTLRQRANATYYAGQMPPQNIFNPLAWREFIRSWKRGDYKRKSY